MTTQIKMHPKPAIRHTRFVQRGTAEVSIVIPGEGYCEPGVYVRLSTRVGQRDGTQLVIFPIDQLDELEKAIKILRACRQ